MNCNKLFTIKPISLDDVSDIIKMSQQAKTGLSNLPKTRKATISLINESIQSFNNDIPTFKKKFIFVLKNEHAIGISGIKARTGIKRPYYSLLYQKHLRYPTLELTKSYLGPSEIGTLFLLPEYRNKKIGRLLSLARFLFIRNFSNYFSKVIVAELRGFLTKDNQSPIWQAIGKKFIPISFHQADFQSMTNLTFIENHFPKIPIPLNLVNKKVTQYLQQVHPFTEGAKQLLLKENFNITNHVDIFDGGPKLECLTSKIRTVNQSKQIPFSQLHHHLHKNLLISNTKFTDFRACKATPQSSLKAIKSSLMVSKSDNILFIEEKPSLDTT